MIRNGSTGLNILHKTFSFPCLVINQKISCTRADRDSLIFDPGRWWWWCGTGGSWTNDQKSTGKKRQVWLQFSLITSTNSHNTSFSSLPQTPWHSHDSRLLRVHSMITWILSRKWPKVCDYGSSTGMAWKPSLCFQVQSLYTLKLVQE